MLTSLIMRWKLRRLIASWTEYRTAVLAEREPGATTAHQEQEFLALKARIATLLPLIMSGSAAAAMDSQNHVRAMTELLNRFRTLDAGMGEGRDREEFERRWHEHFLYLNRLKGMKLGGEKVASSKRPASVPTGLPVRRMQRGVPGLWMLRFAFQLAVLAAVLYGIVWVLGVHRDQATGHIMTGHTRSAGEVGVAGGQLLSSVWHGATTFLQPVIQTYGPESTFVLVGALMLGVGYWFFIRRS